MVPISKTSISEVQKSIPLNTPHTLRKISEYTQRSGGACNTLRVYHFELNWDMASKLSLKKLKLRSVNFTVDLITLHIYTEAYLTQINTSGFFLILHTPFSVKVALFCNIYAFHL